MDQRYPVSRDDVLYIRMNNRLFSLGEILAKIEDPTMDSI